MGTTKDNKKAKGLINPDIEHEYSDINAGAVFKFGVGLVVIAIILHLVTAGFYRVFEVLEEASNPPKYPLYDERAKLPPQPRLQADPISELKQVREAEAKALGYEIPGPKFEGEGSEHNPTPKPPEGKKEQKPAGIPIEKAMEQVLQQGFPVRATSTTDWKDKADVMPEDSSSGRLNERRLR